MTPNTDYNFQVSDFLIKTLASLKNSNTNISQFLNINKNGISLVVDNEELLKITRREIILNKKLNVLDKIVATDSKAGQKSTVKIDKLFSFFDQIRPLIVRLNHLGVNYFCKDTKKELQQYKNTLNGSGFKLYEERLEGLAERCFFIGDALDCNSPLFEITLLEDKRSTVDYWRPHFQIDIDTDLSFAELSKTSSLYFGQNFFKYKINIPNYGTVFGIGVLGIIQGIKICLGIGTRLRITEYHRKIILREL
ncbi:MAG: hypothetical protein ABH867_00650 [Patescibacteria group bacterium]|nr:hypothetical protein [Patescibacteria group bacterium]